MTGLLVVVPLGASILILIWVFTSIDNILQPIVRAIAGRNIPGVGFGVTIILIYLAGVVARNFLGKKLMIWGNSILVRVPVLRGLYTGIRQIMQSVAATDRASFMQVVLVEFPRKEMWTVGFVTKEITTEDGEKFVNVLIPTSPTPWSGYFQILKEKDIIRTQISVEEAVKMIVSGGMTVPPGLHNKLSH
ncbi:MAG: hypothetical protein A2Y92_03590 [Chloroflexi bacterium RBG_13_57_8]|nr:MAG: hypothetical protein A2Y92_03590 [Chloroflexi bacterium RBG_13_57_8]